MTKTDINSGSLTQLSPLVTRLIAPNSGAFTYTGTCTYIIGRDTLSIIDPGPECSVHFAALLKAVNGRYISHILVTHTHKDHSSLARQLSAATGAPVWGCDSHFASRPLFGGEINRLQGSCDIFYTPDRVLEQGDVVKGQDYSLEVVATPGHTMNHLSFVLNEENTLFCGDHVMGWSTTIIAPPDGNMAAYMASLNVLNACNSTIYYPGHGAEITQPKRLVRGIIMHRKQREQAIYDKLKTGDTLIKDITLKLYQHLPPTLLGGAMLSVFAHIEHLLSKGLIQCADEPTIDKRYYINSNQSLDFKRK